MKFYQCSRCQSRIFFENLVCLSCGGELGYLPGADIFETKQVNTGSEDGNWIACVHRDDLGCNWLLEKNDHVATGQAKLCKCCRYTKTFPPQSDASFKVLWSNLERAKRYLFRSLIALKLPMPDREEDPDFGLAFEFLTDLPGTKVFTGHANGVITVNIAEADDVQREQRRVALHEPYRTLLGHLRHESGHFYWDRLITTNDLRDQFRKLFGDERSGYAEALQRHYANSDNGMWRAKYNSHYASSHPWEDWAETWAHYLHIHDALDTAFNWEVSVPGRMKNSVPRAIGKHHSERNFKDRITQEWLPLSQYLNATCRSLGESDAYPYVLSSHTIDKLAFVHSVIAARSTLLSKSADDNRKLSSAAGQHAPTVRLEHC